MNNPQDSALDASDCGCGDASTPQFPLEIANRPGLPGIAYRIGTHQSFKQSLLARLGSVPGFRARDDSDFAIGLLDAWSAVADVLSFYQERIANESYLRTATERGSLLELARLIEYEWRPGVAASVHLAFTLESAPGAPEQAASPTIVAAGLRIQSMPGPGALPQVFETMEDFEARPEWNGMRPRITQEQPVSPDMAAIVLKGAATGIKPGDSLLIVTDGDNQGVQRAVSVVLDAIAGTTRVALVADPPDPQPFMLRRLAVGAFALDRRSLTNRVIRSNVLNHVWRQDDLIALASVQKWPIRALVRNIAVQIAHRPLPPGTGVFAFRDRAALFGHNAQRWNALPASQRFGERVIQEDGTQAFVPAAYPDNWDSPAATLDDTGIGRQIDLDRTYPNIAIGSWIVLESPTHRQICRVEDTAEISVSNYGMSGKVTRLRLDTDTGFDQFKLRETTVFVQSEELDVADLPIVDVVEGSTLVLDAVYPGLKTGQNIILTGTRSDLDGVVASEVLTLADILISDGFTALVFREALANSYLRDTVAICANVVLATHGETVLEILGSGDAGKPYQQFTLRQQPLTYVSSDAQSGSASTLQIRVNDLAWREVPSFYGSVATDRVFTTRIGDDGTTTVQFGDGVNGARPPTGSENIRAIYRKGIGVAGNVAAGQLSLLSSRPQGVRGVVNPLPSAGAADPEGRDELRRNAPLTVLTLDRIVSLQDYENFAGAFAGVAKALATWTWSGQQRGVFITIAGAEGADVEPGSSVYDNLLAAIAKAGDPYVPVRVQTYARAFFRLSGTVTIAPAWQKDIVMAAVAHALRSQFSFEARGFGQPVALSEVMAVIQSVKGVAAVDIDELVRTDGVGGDGIDQPLPAALPQTGMDMTPVAAELLVLDPRPVELVGASS